MERYYELRKELFGKRLTYSDVAGKLKDRSGKKRSVSYVSRRMNELDDYTISDAYIILKLINKPDSDLHIYFPRSSKLK